LPSEPFSTDDSVNWRRHQKPEFTKSVGLFHESMKAVSDFFH